jgi:hypothetical protein
LYSSCQGDNLYGAVAESVQAKACKAFYVGSNPTRASEKMENTNTKEPSNWKDFMKKKGSGKPMNEKDLEELNIWQNSDKFKNDLYRSDERKDCILIQGGAFVVDGYAYLVLGMSTIDILETMSEHKRVTGIIGTGNSLYISKDFKNVYTTLSEEETEKRYEIDKTGGTLKYAYQAKLAPLIFLNRSIREAVEFNRIRDRGKNHLLIDLGSNFYMDTLKYSGSRKSRLRWKFVKAARTGRCVANPSLNKKELLFDEEEAVLNAIRNFKGSFCLGYMKWTDAVANAVGLIQVKALDLKDNISGIIGFSLLKIAEDFRKRNGELYE